jgi:hypothetical protein
LIHLQHAPFPPVIGVVENTFLPEVALGGSIFDCHKPHKWVNFALPQPPMSDHFDDRLFPFSLGRIFCKVDFTNFFGAGGKFTKDYRLRQIYAS